MIELKSSRDRLPKLKEKMREYMDNGSQLGWLINPDDHSVIIYRPNGETETRTGIDSITGEGPVATFTLDLKRIWKPI